MDERPQATTTTWDRSGFVKGWGIGTVLLTAVYAVMQVVASKNDDNPAVREAWASDVVAVVIASLLFAAIACGFALRAGRGSDERRSRTVVGLVVLTVVAMIAWWSAAPVIVALSAVLLGRATGVSDRESGHGGARTAAVLAIVVCVGLLTFNLVVVTAEQL